MKKITSVLLTVVMLVSMLSATASATSGSTYVEATASVDSTSQIVTVAFTAAQPTTNGKITVEYTPDSLIYVDCDVTGTASSVSQRIGTVTFGYGTSTSDTIQAGETVATLTLNISPNASGTTYLKVNVEEFNGATSFVGDFSLGIDLGEPSSEPDPVFPGVTPTPTPTPTPGTGSGSDSGTGTGNDTTGGDTAQPAEPAPAGPTTPATGPVTTDDVTDKGTVVTETTAVIESTTVGGTASASVSTEIAAEIVDQAVRNNSGSVVISPEMGSSVTEAEVSIPASMVADIAEKTNANVLVETPVASVSISNGGLSSLASAGGEVSVSAERSGITLAVTISANGQQVNQVAGGVTVSIPQEGCTPGTVAMLVREDGTTEVIRMSVASSDGKSITVPLSGSAKVVIVDNSVSLSDVPANHWAAGAVAFATSHELMKGTGDGVFDPNLSMTRSMLAVVLHNLESNAAVSGGVSFSDVSADAWYADAVAWAASKGIITGYTDNRFAPDDSITREQLAVMLYRYAGQPAASASGLNFVDADKISGYAQQAITWAVANGIMSGKGGGVLDPGGTATRAEVAKMLMNFVSSMA